MDVERFRDAAGEDSLVPDPAGSFDPGDATEKPGERRSGPALREGVFVRPFAPADAEGLGDILHRTWDYGVTEPEAVRWEGLMDLYLCLERSSVALVAEVDGRPAGVAIARDPYLGDGGFGDAGRLNTIQNELGRFSQGRRALRWLADERWADKDLLASTDEPYSCEVTLFVCDGQVRGRGVGGRLFTTLLDTLRDLGVEGIHLFTDTGCDWGFYDYHGFTLRAEREFPQGRGGRAYTAFLFDKPLVEDSLEDL